MLEMLLNIVGVYSGIGMVVATGMLLVPWRFPGLDGWLMTVLTWPLVLLALSFRPLVWLAGSIAWLLGWRNA